MLGAGAARSDSFGKRNSPGPRTVPFGFPSSPRSSSSPPPTTRRPTVAPPRVAITSCSARVRSCSRLITSARSEGSSRSPRGPIVMPTSACSRSPAARSSSSTQGQVRNASVTACSSHVATRDVAEAPISRTGANCSMVPRARMTAPALMRCAGRVDDGRRHVDVALEDESEREARHFVLAAEGLHRRGAGERGARVVGEVAQRFDLGEIDAVAAIAVVGGRGLWALRRRLRFGSGRRGRFRSDSASRRGRSGFRTLGRAAARPGSRAGSAVAAGLGGLRRRRCGLRRRGRTRRGLRRRPSAAARDGAGGGPGAAEVGRRRGRQRLSPRRRVRFDGPPRPAGRSSPPRPIRTRAWRGARVRPRASGGGTSRPISRGRLGVAPRVEHSGVRFGRGGHVGGRGGRLQDGGRATAGRAVPAAGAEAMRATRAGCRDRDVDHRRRLFHGDVVARGPAGDRRPPRPRPGARVWARRTVRSRCPGSARSTPPARPRRARARARDRRPRPRPPPAPRAAATRSRRRAPGASRGHPPSATPRSRPRRRWRSRSGSNASSRVVVSPGAPSRSMDGAVRHEAHPAGRKARTEPSSEPMTSVPSLSRVAGASTSPPATKRQSSLPLASTA